MSSAAPALPAVALDPNPFDLRARGLTAGAREPHAVLCLHGLTATPYELRPVAEALVARGMRARGPLLPGHGTTPQELAHVPWEAWLAAARQTYVELAAAHVQVFAVGMSMGGLLCLALAAEAPIAGIVTIGTPLELCAPPDPLLALIQLVHPFLNKREGPDIRDPAARARHPTYRVMPVASVRQLTRLQRFVAERLDRVRAPLLAAHGRHDRTVRPIELDRLLARVGSQHKERLLLDESAHIATVDYDGAELVRRIVDFLGVLG